MHNRILIIAKSFAPKNKISAIRVTKLAKYLKIIGNYNITVICEDAFGTNYFSEDLNQDLQHIDSYHPIYSPSLQYKNRYGEYEQRKKGVIVYLIRAILHLIDNILFIIKAKKIIRKSSQPPFDLVFTSCGPLSTTLIGRWVKKCYNPFWISDFRDPPYDPTQPFKLFAWYFKSFVRRVSKKADVITAVSQGCLEGLLFEEHPNRVILTNGYDRQDIEHIAYSEATKLTFSYLGTIYPNYRDLTPLFKVVDELIREDAISTDGLKIFYAGRAAKEFEKQVNLFPLEEIIEISAPIQRYEALKRQLESQILVLASWNNQGNEGVISGKFLEYMMMDRPILALVSGTLPNSQIKEMITAGNLGFCYEEANKEEDEVLLKEYILKQYKCFKEKQSLAFNPDKSFVEQFDYRNIAKQLIALFPQELRRA